MLRQLHGMFAFVLWDKKEQKGFAARDPYGIKPLYISTTRNGVIVTSQVKALLATGLIDLSPDERGQAGFWMLGSVPEPHTWYRAIHALPAGHCAWIQDHRVVMQRRWHDIGAVWRAAARLSECDLPFNTLQTKIRESLKESVTRHLVSDVPVAVFLSGGIDSGTIAALMREAGCVDLHGITIGYDEFEGKWFDEIPVAEAIAQHCGIHHHVRKVGREEFLSDLPRIMDAMDQPSIDGINTWYASKAVAERGFKVVVSGVGGDELFFGYPSFRQLPRLMASWRVLSRMPGTTSMVKILTRLQARRSGNLRWLHAPDWLKSIAGAWWLRRSCNAPESVHELMGRGCCELLTSFNPESWVESMTGVLAADPTLALAQIESTTYLRNQLLRDSDWASMDHSVELRTPLVDAHLLSQLQPLLPLFRRYPGKTLLANSPERPLPEQIVKRRKSGFAIPIEAWLRQGMYSKQTLQEEILYQWLS